MTTEPPRCRDQSFGALIRARAHAAGLHGQPLSYVLTAAWRSEAGHATRPRTLARLADVLNLPVEELLGHVQQPETELGQLIQHGLARAGLSIADVVTQLGISRPTWNGWVDGRHQPSGDHLARLAHLLDEPALTSQVVPYRPAGKIRLVCPDCGSSRMSWPGSLQQRLEREQASGTNRIVVDWDAGHGTAPCHRCSARTTGLQKAERLRKRGRAALRQFSAELHRHRQRWSQEHPEEAANILEKLHEGRRVHEPSALETARQGLGSLSLDPPGQFGLCRLCGLLTFAKEKDIARTVREGRPRYGQFHGPCYRAWTRSPEVRAWTSKRQRAGARVEAFPLPPQSSPRQSSPAELRTAYVTTVRFFRQQEESKRADRDEHGQPLDIVRLADALNLNRRTLYNRVQRFLALLPDEITATGQVKIWRDVFLTIRAARREGAL